MEGKKYLFKDTHNIFIYCYMACHMVKGYSERKPAAFNAWVLFLTEGGGGGNYLHAHIH